jgi:hypothetical protein
MLNMPEPQYAKEKRHSSQKKSELICSAYFQNKKTCSIKKCGLPAPLAAAAPKS